MQHFLSLSLLMLFCSLGFAQKDLEGEYQKKINSEFLKKVTWTQTLKEALEQSKAQNKLILAYFTRSYAP